MEHRLKADESVAKGVERIVDKQLALAILELRESGAPRPDDLPLYERALRLRAALLGRRVSSEKPRHVVRRVRRLWQSQATRPTLVPGRRTWPQAA